MKKIEKIKLNFVPLLFSGATDEPWDSTLQSLQAPFLREGILSPETIAYEVVAQVIEGGWACSTHWTYKKKWKKRYKVPRRSNSEESEARGDVLLAILNLCEALHTIHSSGERYGNAARRTEAVGWEIKNAELERSFNSKGKQAYIAHLRKNIDAYRCGENPHDPTLEPHLWELVETALQVKGGENYPDLIDKFWLGKREKTGERYPHKGFIHAWSGLATCIDGCKNYVTFSINAEGKLFVHGGRNNVLEIPQAMLEKLVQEY